MAGFLTCRDFHSVEIPGRLENLPYTRMESALISNFRQKTSWQLVLHFQENSYRERQIGSLDSKNVP